VEEDQSVTTSQLSTTTPLSTSQLPVPQLPSTSQLPAATPLVTTGSQASTSTQNRERAQVPTIRILPIRIPPAISGGSSTKMAKMLYDTDSSDSSADVYESPDST
jgi:hypothetical protein